MTTLKSTCLTSNTALRKAQAAVAEALEAFGNGDKDSGLAVAEQHLAAVKSARAFAARIRRANRKGQVSPEALLATLSKLKAYATPALISKARKAGLEDAEALGRRPCIRHLLCDLHSPAELDAAIATDSSIQDYLNG